MAASTVYGLKKQQYPVMQSIKQQIPIYHPNGNLTLSGGTDET